MTKRPFSNDYVIRETLKHMARCVDISIEKTISRVDEFGDDPDGLKEFLTTMSNLDKLKQTIASIRNENKDLIGE